MRQAAKKRTPRTESRKQYLHRKFDLAVKYAKRYVPAGEFDALLGTVTTWAVVHAHRRHESNPAQAQELYKKIEEECRP